VIYYRPILFDHLTFIRTSPVFGGATSTVSKVSGFFATQETAARHFIVCKITTTLRQKPLQHVTNANKRSF